MFSSYQAIVEAERLIQRKGLPYLILRFGGLAGPNRHPGRFLSRMNNIPNSGQTINYLHLQDAIDSTVHLINRDKWNEIYNVVSPGHPTKMEFYSKMAQLLKLPSPNFDQSTDRVKRIVTSDKLIETDYEFFYADPMNFEF